MDCHRSATSSSPSRTRFASAATTSPDRRGALVEAVRAQSEQRPSTEPLSSALLDEAVRTLRAQFDPKWGGFGSAPKFPPASVLEFLLRPARLSGSELQSPPELELAAKTLDAMAAGACTTWSGRLPPLFGRRALARAALREDALRQRFLLVPAYLHGWAVTGNERWRRVAEQTLEYILRELRLSEGGFASAQDADTEGVEGLTYTWTPEEFVAQSHKLEAFEHGRFIVRGELDDETRAAARDQEQRPQPFGRQGDRVLERAGACRPRRGVVPPRARRPPGSRSRARRVPARTSLSPDGALHAWRNGVAKGPAFLDDYANVAHGLYELHVATGDLRWLHEALRLALRAVELFVDDEHGGFFMTPTGGEELVARKKDLDDNPTPSGNSMLAYVLLRLSRIWATTSSSVVQ